MSLPPSLPLTDKAVVVTGGASGIGRACAELLIERGAKVAIWDLAADTLDVAERFRAGVVKDFIARVRQKALGQEVLASLTPGQALVGVVHDELVEKLRRAAEESLSRRAVEKGSRACPACAMPVEKVSISARAKTSIP